MTIYHWICLIAFTICFISCLIFFFRTLLAGFPGKLAETKGKSGPAIVYAFTEGMSPAKKETAFLHLPTYTAGILFHLGTFAGFGFLMLIFINLKLPLWLTYAGSIYLAISFIAGLSILIKRAVIKKMRSISNPDDYISNVLVTVFHLIVAMTLLWHSLMPFLLVYSSVLFLYMPLGKLRHTVYFFTSRIHLGIFYGRRGVWPVKQKRYEKYLD